MDKILEVKKLKVSFRTNSGALKAVRNISFDLERGKTLAIVGESGSGKSVTSKAIIGILAGNSIVEGGEILYDGHDLLREPEEELQHIRGDKISMIFQDPLSSLNPIVRVGKQITEATLLKNRTNRREAGRVYDAQMKRLIAAMNAACPGKEGRIKELTSAFTARATEAAAMAQKFNDASSAAGELLSSAKDTQQRLGRGQDVKIKKLQNEWKSHLGRVNDEFIIEGRTQAIAEWKTKLNAADAPALRTLLDSFIPFLQEMADVPAPAFNQLACERKGGMSYQALVDELLPLVESGIRYSAEHAMERKVKVVDTLKSAHDWFSADFEHAAAKHKVKALTAEVEASIDRLEIIKDSTAYAFGMSLGSAVEHFFSDQVHNRKEEKRFATQTKRRERLIARGRTVEWKVVPKNVYPVEDLRDNILTVVDRLAERYEEAHAAFAGVDHHAAAEKLLAWFEARKVDAVYRITPYMAREKAIRLMEEVGISDPRTRYNQFPFEFSGGMRQRIVIAIALAADPDILICDEPTTALDVTIQAQILELINKLKEERGLSVIFITHDLGVVANVADDIAVMYAGKIVEYGTADDIFYDPRHPYTWALLASMPDLDTKETLETIPGTPPNMIYPPVGDAFADRNKYALKIDYELEPPMFRISDTHSAATWLLHENAPKVEPPKIITDRIARMKQKAGGEQHV